VRAAGSLQATVRHTRTGVRRRAATASPASWTIQGRVPGRCLCAGLGQLQPVLGKQLVLHCRSIGEGLFGEHAGTLPKRPPAISASMRRTSSPSGLGDSQRLTATADAPLRHQLRPAGFRAHMMRVARELLPRAAAYDRRNTGRAAADDAGRTTDPGRSPIAQSGSHRHGHIVWTRACGSRPHVVDRMLGGKHNGARRHAVPAARL